MKCFLPLLACILVLPGCKLQEVAKEIQRQRVGQNEPATPTARNDAIERVAEGPYSRLQVSGEDAVMGIFDPSVEYGEGTGWLAYSAVEPKLQVSTRIARSTDQGATWRTVAKVNGPTATTVTNHAGRRVTGKWRFEVPSLVYDPGDKGQEWKLFTHKYFHGDDGKRDPSIGWITYQHAARPDGDWSEEVALFGAGRNPPAPLETRIDLNRLSPDLANMVAYTEPGTLYRDGSLYLSLTGLTGKGPTIVFLLRSRDHGRNWEYVGKLVDRDDAAAFGYESFDGSSLVEENSRIFLLVAPSRSPGEAKRKSKMMHEGTFVIEFEDLDSARLSRNDGGLGVFKHIRPDFGKDWGGQSDYHEQNTAGGLIMPHFSMQARPSVFQMVNTGKRIAE